SLAARTAVPFGAAIFSPSFRRPSAWLPNAAITGPSTGAKKPPDFPRVATAGPRGAGLDRGLGSTFARAVLTGGGFGLEIGAATDGWGSRLLIRGAGFGFGLLTPGAGPGFGVGFRTTFGAVTTGVGFGINTGGGITGGLGFAR
ncbi:MAG: hypothetical protein ACKVH0_09145, partial [Alphaproteobacteria bacterium]